MKSVTEDRTMEHMIHILLPDLVKEVSAKMKKLDIELSTDTLIKVLRLTMESVEESPLKGVQQKDLAIKIIVELANISGLTAENIAIIKGLVEGELISSTIDLVVDAAKGNVNVNNVSKVATGCLTRLLDMFLRRNRNIPDITVPEKETPLLPPKQEEEKEEQQEEKKDKENKPEKATVRAVTPVEPVIKREKKSKLERIDPDPVEPEEEPVPMEKPVPMTGVASTDVLEPTPQSITQEDKTQEDNKKDNKEDEKITLDLTGINVEIDEKETLEAPR